MIRIKKRKQKSPDELKADIDMKARQNSAYRLSKEMRALAEQVIDKAIELERELST